HDTDRASYGVRAEERALRTLQDLDAIHIEEVLIGADGAREIDAVQVDADARIQVERKVILTDAADGGGKHRPVAREGRPGIEIDVGRQIAQSVDVGHAFGSE